MLRSLLPLLILLYTLPGKAQTSHANRAIEGNGAVEMPTNHGKTRHSTGAWYQKLQPQIHHQPTYQPKAGAVILKMDFALHRIYNPQAVKAVQEKVKRVDLVYTRYPYHLEEWEVGYDSLMERRFTELNKLLPRAFSDPEVEWRLVLQTDCRNMEEAQGLFHGFCIYSGPKEESLEKEKVFASEEVPNPNSNPVPPPVPHSPRFDSIDLEANLKTAIELFSGERTFYDSTCQWVFERNPNWGSKVLIIDWTASMFKHGAQVMHWIEQAGKKDEILGVVFFNDGDDKWDNEKEIGSTGGIYTVEGFDHDSIVAMMERVSYGGSGGDHRENDLEAVMEAMDRFPEADEFVLIADNTGPVRDLTLVKDLERSLRILLCGVYHDRFEPDYLTIAHHTGGSIHTRDQDLEGLGELGQFQKLELTEASYILVRGKFKKLKQ